MVKFNNIASIFPLSQTKKGLFAPNRRRRHILRHAPPYLCTSGSTFKTNLDIQMPENLNFFNDLIVFMTNYLITILKCRVSYLITISYQVNLFCAIYWIVPVANHLFHSLTEKTFETRFKFFTRHFWIRFSTWHLIIKNKTIL